MFIAKSAARLRPYAADETYVFNSIRNNRTRAGTAPQLVNHSGRVSRGRNRTAAGRGAEFDDLPLPLQAVSHNTPTPASSRTDVDRSAGPRALLCRGRRANRIAG